MQLRFLVPLLIRFSSTSNPLPISKIQKTPQSPCIGGLTRQYCRLLNNQGAGQMGFKLMIWLASLSTIKNRNSKRGKWTDVTKEIARHILRRYKHRKFREYGIVWKATLLVTPYIRVKRGCAGIKPRILILPGGQYIAKCYV